jgi:hypothetical protein
MSPENHHPEIAQEIYPQQRFLVFIMLLEDYFLIMFCSYDLK